MVGFYKPSLKNMFKELSFTFPREIALKRQFQIFLEDLFQQIYLKKKRESWIYIKVVEEDHQLMIERNWDYIVDKKLSVLIQSKVVK